MKCEVLSYANEQPDIDINTFLEYSFLCVLLLKQKAPATEVWGFTRSLKVCPGGVLDY